MANITRFNENALPSFLVVEEEELDNSLAVHASTTFPVLSIKGKVFSIVRDGERRVIPNPKDPESPASNLQVVILKASSCKVKAYYEEAFKEGVEDMKPACFSNDGVKPDAASANPQCATCAACRWNAFGSAKAGADGIGGKGKACSDAIRVAVASPTAINEPLMLRVPPTSIKALGEYGSTLLKRKIPFQAVITQIGFIQEEASPKLSFKPVGFADQELYLAAKEEANSETVDIIVHGTPSAQQALEQPPAYLKKETSAPAPLVQPAPARVAEPKAEDLKQASVNQKEIADDILAQAQALTGVAVAPAPAPAPVAKPKAKVVESASDLDATFADLDFDE